MISLNVRALAEMRTILERLRDLVTDNEVPVEDRAAYGKWIAQMIEIVEPLGMALTMKSLSQAKEIIERGERWKGELKRPMDDFHGRFRDELETRTFFALSLGS